MAAVGPYIPVTDAGLDAFLANFSALITAAPATYGLVAGDAVVIAGEVAAWSAAYLPVLSPTTKTRAAVAAKNAARVTVVALIRTYAQQVANNPGVDPGDKVALGLNPKTSKPSPVSAPTSAPVLLVQSASNLALIVRYRDSAAGVKVKAKPFGAIGCEIYAKVSATPVVLVSDLTFYQRATKSPVVIEFGGSDGGKQVYLASRWVTRTGLYSPWSSIVSFTIPLGT